jgi:crotonobetainyl-CoA:carnitine CoA-transferase CaiB-like acyl-CoA transferase
MSQEHAWLPLNGVRVLDLCDGTGELASRYLADLGADVVRLEPSAPVEDVFARATHSANKRSIRLDLGTAADLDAFWTLAAGCDIVFENSAPATHDTSPVAPAVLRARLPHLVVVSLTEFGQSGPYRDWQGGDAIHYALSSVLSRSGLPGMDPLLPPGALASQSAAIQAAWAGLVAYFNRLDTGAGDFVDASVLESTLQVLDPAWGIGGSATGGVPAANGPRGRPDARHLYPIFGCADGWVRLCILAPRQWQGMFTWLGEPEELADPALASLPKRFAAADRIYPAIGRMLATKTRATITAEAQQFGVPAAALLSPAEVLTAEQFQAREAFVTTQVDGNDVAVVNGLVEVDGRRAGIRRHAAAPGEHTAEVLAEATSAASAAARDEAESTDSLARSTSGERRLPLEGLRVMDLGVIVVGAELGRLFADMGAEVIKVENKAFPDGSRQSMTGDPMTASFAWGHRNKSSLGLNLRDPGGVEVFKQLAAVSDVVLSNFKPGTLESLGLGYDVLSELNPGIVMADSSAFGPTGPWSRRMGYGPLVRSETSLSVRWSYPGVDGSYSDASTIYPDHIAARVGAVAVLALLLRRRRTGAGGTVSVAQAEVILGQMAADLARESAAPGSVGPVGNELPGDAPRGVFPAAGDDEWVVVDVRSDDQFAALARTLQRPELIGDARYVDGASRHAHRSDLADVITAWTSTRTPREAAERLQAAGVPAAPMNRVADLLADPHLVVRDYFTVATHPLIADPLPSEKHPAVFETISDVPLRPAPLPGEQSRDVLANVLGMGRQHIEHLVATGVIEETLPEPSTSREPTSPATSPASTQAPAR